MRGEARERPSLNPRREENEADRTHSEAAIRGLRRRRRASSSDVGRRARHQLIKVALKAETISYSELWDKLLASDAGPAPKGLWRYRVGTLLYRVAKLNGKNHEPLLTALVVQKLTGEVSEGYEDGVAACYGYSPANITSHARSERIKIALWAGTDL